MHLPPIPPKEILVVDSYITCTKVHRLHELHEVNMHIGGMNRCRRIINYIIQLHGDISITHSTNQLIGTFKGEAHGEPLLFWEEMEGEKDLGFSKELLSPLNFP